MGNVLIFTFQIINLFFIYAHFTFQPIYWILFSNDTFNFHMLFFLFLTWFLFVEACDCFMNASWISLKY